MKGVGDQGLAVSDDATGEFKNRQADIQYRPDYCNSYFGREFCHQDCPVAAGVLKPALGCLFINPVTCLIGLFPGLNAPMPERLRCIPKAAGHKSK